MISRPPSKQNTAARPAASRESPAARWRIAKAGAWARAAPKRELTRKRSGACAASAAVSAGPLQSLEARQLVGPPATIRQTAQACWRAPTGKAAWTLGSVPRSCRPKLSRRRMPSPALAGLRRATGFHVPKMARLNRLGQSNRRSARRGSLIQVLGISTPNARAPSAAAPPAWLPSESAPLPHAMGNGIGVPLRCLLTLWPDGVSSQQLERAWTDHCLQKIRLK